MSRGLKVTIGQYSDKGRKSLNQDFHGAMIPEPPTLGVKGIALAVADGIGSSNVSHIASESAVAGFLSDYYCTSDSWSVKTSAQRVIAATNSWLHAQTRRGGHAHDPDRGYVCTFSAVVVKSATAHLFHIGDSRISRVAGKSLEPLTTDHRVTVSAEQSYLGRALGMNGEVEIDYRAVPLERGDIFVLATDGVHEHVPPAFAVAAITESADDLDRAAQDIGQEAYRRGSTDNLTVQILRIDNLPDGDAGEILDQALERQLPPLLEPRAVFEGYRILRSLHASSRSHVYLAEDIEARETIVLKIPSLDLRGDADYLRRFMMEEWVARRIDNAHVLKPRIPNRQRHYLYLATEYVEGQTLTQWIADNPRPDLETVRGIVEQIARGLRAFHRMEMLHRDLRPENIMIDRNGTVKIIDFGSVAIRGVTEAAPTLDRGDVLGTVQYTAPEVLTGDPATARADLFSLGVIAYQMLTGNLPYGGDAARVRTKQQLRKLMYRPVRRDVPPWIDLVLRKAVHPDAVRRYEELSEFVHDLRQPPPEFLNPAYVPLTERNPLLFWQALSFVLACIVLVLLSLRWP